MTVIVALWMLAGCSPLQGSERLDVPGGEFRQGSDRAPDEPERTVTASAFAIDRTEVSVAAFERFAEVAYDRREWWSEEGWQWVQDHPEGAGPAARSAGRDDSHPVVAVSWFEADAYCRWKGGGRPTEAQWERAACGRGGQRYAWGDDEAVAAAWYAGGKFGHIDRVATVPVGEQATDIASPFGLLHTAGNVWEWTADRYHRDGYRGQSEPVRDPTGPAAGPWRTLRGGSFMNLPSYCTCTHREPARPDRVAFTTGLRCAYPAP